MKKKKYMKKKRKKKKKRKEKYVKNTCIWGWGRERGYRPAGMVWVRDDCCGDRVGMGTTTNIAGTDGNGEVNVSLRSSLL